MRNQSQSSIITPLSCPIKDVYSRYYVPSVQSEGRYMYDVVYVRTPLQIELDRVKKLNESRAVKKLSLISNVNRNFNLTCRYEVTLQWNYALIRVKISSDKAFDTSSVINCESTGIKERIINVNHY